MWNLPESGVKPVSTVLASRFLSTGPLEKSWVIKKNCYFMTALDLRCGMKALVSWPGIKLRSPALGVWSLSHWTSREVSSLDKYSAHGSTSGTCGFWPWGEHYAMECLWETPRRRPSLAFPSSFQWQLEGVEGYLFSILTNKVSKSLIT